MVQILVLEMLFKRKKEIFLIKIQACLLYKISNKFLLKVKVKLQKENSYIIII
jgi:hypothetical protein